MIDKRMLNEGKYVDEWLSLVSCWWQVNNSEVAGRFYNNM